MGVSHANSLPLTGCTSTAIPREGRKNLFVEIIPRKQRLSLLLNLDFADCEDPSAKARDATEYAFIIGATEAGGVLYNLESQDDVPAAINVVRQAYERVTE